MKQQQKTLLTGAALGILGVALAARAGFAQGFTSAVVPPRVQVGGGTADSGAATTQDQPSWWQFWK